MGGSCQLMERCLPLGGLQVQHHALLVHIERLEEVAVVWPKKIRAHAAGGIATGIATFNLDDFSTEVREVQRTKRTGAEVLEGEDAIALQRLAIHSGFRAASWRAIMMRCISFVPSPIHMSGASRKKRSMS